MLNNHLPHSIYLVQQRFQQHPILLDCLKNLKVAGSPTVLLSCIWSRPTLNIPERGDMRTRGVFHTTIMNQVIIVVCGKPGMGSMGRRCLGNWTLYLFVFPLPTLEFLGEGKMQVSGDIGFCSPTSSAGLAGSTGVGSSFLSWWPSAPSSWKFEADVTKEAGMSW